MVIYPASLGAKTYIDPGIKLQRCQKSPAWDMSKLDSKQTAEVKLSLNCKSPAISPIAAKRVFAPAWGSPPVTPPSCPQKGWTSGSEMPDVLLKPLCKLGFGCWGGRCYKAVAKPNQILLISSALRALMDLNSPEQPHLGSPHTQEHF